MMRFSGKTAACFALFAAFAGVSFCFGHLAGLFYNGRSYTPLVYDRSVLPEGAPQYLYKLDHVLWDEATAYARYTQEILRGELSGKNLASYQAYITGAAVRSPRWCRDRGGPLLLAGLALLFSGNVPAAFIAADFLFPALLTFSALLLCRKFFEDPPLGALGASLVVWWNAWDLIGLLYFHWGAPHYGPIFVRTAYPQVSAIFYVLLLLAMIRLRDHPGPGGAAWLAAALALNFYTYVYSWSFGMAVIAAWLALLALPVTGPMAAGGCMRRRTALWLAAAALAALLASFPAWLPAIARPAAVQDSFVRLGGEATHQPEWEMLVVGGVFLGAAFFAGRRGWKRSWFWMVFWLAAAAAMNQQVITGIRIQPFHYLPNFIGPLAPLFLWDLVWWRAGGSLLRARRRAYALAACAALLGFGQCAWRLARPMREDRWFHQIDRNFAEVLELLRTPSLRDCGFLTNDPFLNEILPAFVVEKPLDPWRMDPLSNREMDALHHAAAAVLGEPGVHESGLPYRLERRKTLLILNRHRRIDAHPAACQILLSNEDFLVARPAPCGS
jgi:hypothetical protein